MYVYILKYLSLFDVIGTLLDNFDCMVYSTYGSFEISPLELP